MISNLIASRYSMEPRSTGEHVTGVRKVHRWPKVLDISGVPMRC
jgi:hypothetical protein